MKLIRLAPSWRSTTSFFDPTKEFVLEEFTEQVDTAIDCEKVESKGFTIPRDKISTLHKLGRAVDQSLIKSLTIARQSGGSPEAVVDRLILNGGKELQVSTPEQRWPISIHRQAGC